MFESEQSRWARTFEEQCATPLVMMGLNQKNEIVITMTGNPEHNRVPVRNLLKTALELIEKDEVRHILTR